MVERSRYPQDAGNVRSEPSIAMDAPPPEGSNAFRPYAYGAHWAGVSALSLIQ